MVKELKHCKSIENLVVSDAVKHKSKEFVKKYLSVEKYQPFYKRDDEKLDDDEDGDDRMMNNSPTAHLKSNSISSPNIYHHNQNSNYSTTNSLNTTPTMNQTSTFDSKINEDDTSCSNESAICSNENTVLSNEISVDISNKETSNMDAVYSNETEVNEVNEIDKIAESVQ